MLVDWLFSAGLPLCQRSMFLQDTNNPSNVNMSEGGGLCTAVISMFTDNPFNKREFI